MASNLRITLLLVMAVMAGSAFGQIRTEGIAIGLGGGATMGDTDFGRDNQFGVTVNGFLRHMIAGPFEGQFSGMYMGKLKRDDSNAYETDIASADYRLLLRLFSTRAAGVYLFGGIGNVYFNVTSPPAMASEQAKEDGWELYSPVGGGLRFGLSNHVALDVNGGYNFAFTDDLNKFIDNGDDGYFSGMAGFTWTMENDRADHDGDGLSNREEKKLGTDKKMADSDGDGLNDGDEVKIHQTDPLKPDTDGDGLDDQQEVNIHKSNPRKMDSDQDGLGDHDEAVKFGTNPLNTDSDGDGLNDKDELLVYKTDPLNADSDGDGLTDAMEINTYKTDPLNADSDQGTVADGTEVDRGSDPLNASDDIVKPVEDPAPIVLDGITFESGSAAITRTAEDILNGALSTLQAYPQMAVEIRGYTDNVGQRAFNMRLSLQRAESVRSWLTDKGIADGRMTTRGFGPDNPVTTNATSEGRAKNRRIEFVPLK